jgi:hypothetical protein
MPRLLPWSSAEVGDLDIFAPAVPCLFVNTWYINGEPDSTVSYFWQDERTGMIHHELLFNAPVSYEEAMNWAQAHASASDIERIHVRHARPVGSGRRGKKAPRRALKTARGASRKRPNAKGKVAKSTKTRRRPAAKKSTKK